MFQKEKNNLWVRGREPPPHGDEDFWVRHFCGGLRSVSQQMRSLRACREVVLPLDTCSGDPFTLPLLVFQTHLVLWAGLLFHPWLPYVVDLVVRKHQAWVTIFCWVGGHKTTSNYVPLLVLGVFSLFIFFFMSFRVLFSVPLAFLQSLSSTDHCTYQKGSKRNEFVLLTRQQIRTQYFLKISICTISPIVRNSNPVLELFFKLLHQS